MQENLRLNIIVKGYVQGVGYRYFCYRKAKEFKIKGYVRNLYDGDVELEVEGEEGMINDFVKAVKIGPVRSIINSVKVIELSYEGKFENFNII
jgi:acylphosphatase